jgi:predicted CoA-binding protein
MDHDHYANDYIKSVLTSARRIAVVGASANPARPSYGVMRFLIGKGHTVIPINPGHAGGDILGQPVYGSLADVPGPVDMVDIFRNSDAVPGAVQEAISEKARLGLQSVWMQLGVRNDDAADAAEAAGLLVVMNRCPAIEYPRLGL